jgi:hypothetical protein
LGVGLGGGEGDVLDEWLVLYVVSSSSVSIGRDSAAAEEA